MYVSHRLYFLLCTVLLILFNDFRYQHLIHGGLALYTYLKIVHHNSLNLGAWEWKLHLFSTVFLTTFLTMFYFLDSFGCVGFWMLHDVESISGNLLAGFTILMIVSLAIITCTSYMGIRREVDKQRLKINHSGVVHNGYHSVANQCLSTYVWISRCIYCSMAIAYSVLMIETAVFGVVETTTAFVITIVSNSSGWANAWGFFYNERIKMNRRQSFFRDSRSRISGNTVYSKHGVNLSVEFELVASKA